jgi:Fe-S-cluster-containing dehydrogenase component
VKKWNIIIDVAECTNCNLCALSCQDEYAGNDWPGVAAEMPRHGHRWIDIKRKERGQHPLVDVAYLPVMCQHCDDAPCIKAAKDGAVTKRADGIVIIDPIKAKGQKQIVEACPYDAVFWNEEKQLPQAWPFDAHLLDPGPPPPAPPAPFAHYKSKTRKCPISGPVKGSKNWIRPPLPNPVSGIRICIAIPNASSPARSQCASMDKKNACPVPEFPCKKGLKL